MHVPERSLVLLGHLAELVFFGFLLKEEVAKRLQNVINQKGKNPKLEMFSSFHYMSSEAVFRINDVTCDF